MRQRQLGWVEFFIWVLRICEWPGLPERVTKSYLPPGTALCSLTPWSHPQFLPQLQDLLPVLQDTASLTMAAKRNQAIPSLSRTPNPPKSSGENSEQVSQASFEATPRMFGVSLMPSLTCKLLALSPQRASWPRTRTWWHLHSKF